MVLYDDKTKDAIKTGNQLLIPTINSSEDITFKASYVISSDLNCNGKISALFDLIVFGDVHAEEIDVKGRFVCMGHCLVLGTIVVQNDIWCEDIQANSVTCHDRIVAQSIDADIVIADGNIIIGKTLAIEEKAQTYQNLICGETAYGAGKIVASSILTVEPLDLDDGEETLESPFQYAPKVGSNVTTELSKESVKYAQNNDYSDFLSRLMKVPDEYAQRQFSKYASVLKAVEMAYPSSVSELKDASLLIWLIEISHSEYFKGWNEVTQWTNTILKHFKDMADGKVAGLHEAKPATTLSKGYTVLHQKYGRGFVRNIFQTTTKGKVSRIAIIDFEIHGEKKFPLPDSLKFFSVLSEHETPSADETKASIQCNIGSYPEWLFSLQLINQYKEYLGTSLYDIIYGLLLAKLGLKTKFVEERFKEKGWN